MSVQQLSDIISAFQNPERYPHPVDEIQAIQTHISHVLIAGQYVYKFKKPVNFGFLDFSTLEKRGHFCRREVELNRRLCPDIYLDVIHITREPDGYTMNGSGETVEYGVLMRRMPEDRMMTRLIAAGELREHHLDAIVGKLVPFYAAAGGDEIVSSYGRAESVAVNVLENFQQTETYVGTSALSTGQFDRISQYSRRILANQSRFDKRIRDRRIRDCHGDLYSANICLDTEVHIFDCIEFNERFRYSDVAADVAFLAMDLDFHGLNDLADYFLKRFATESQDPDLLGQVGFYQCYRAYVRGKIGLFTASDPGIDQQSAERNREQAQRYFQLAERYAENER